jgi:hypothetical protein
MWRFWFWVWGLGFWGWGFGFWGLGLGAWGLGLGFGAWVLVSLITYHYSRFTISWDSGTADFGFWIWDFGFSGTVGQMTHVFR